MSRSRLAISSFTLAVAAIVFAGVALARSTASEPGTSNVCKVSVYPGLQPKHVKSLSVKPAYNSDPPTSGTHFYVPAKWNIYTQEIPQIALVHNLEHGGIVVQYGDKVPATTVSRIALWYFGTSNGLVVVPYAKLGSSIVLTAWNEPPYNSTPPKDVGGHGYLATCSQFDQTAFDAFVKAHRYKSGERFPKAYLARGA
jgi:hypothetical protein